MFYKELIDVWKTFLDGVLKDVEFILSQSLSNNKVITSKNNTLYSEELYCKEIKYLSDLIDDEGCLSAWEVISEKFDVLANAFFKEVPLLAILTRNISSNFSPEFLSICEYNS